MAISPVESGIARNRRFVYLWCATTLSTLGDALTTLTLILLLLRRTHSVAAIGALGIVIALPALIFGLLAGAHVDRWNRRRVMVVSDACRAALLLLLAVASLSSVAALPAVYVVAFAQSAVGTFFEPARAAVMQMVVPASQQVRANSLMQTTAVVAELAGTTLAGVLATAVHAYWIAFSVDGATFALAALLVARIAGIVHEPTEQSTTWAAVREGLAAVRSSPQLRALVLILSALTFALAPMMVLLTPYVVDTLDISAAWIGLIQAGDTAGNLVGGTLVALFASRVRPRTLIRSGTLALGVLIASIAWATTVPALLILYFVFGLLTVTIQTGIGALTQTAVDNAMMGRFVGIMAIVPGTVTVLAMAFTGALAAAVGTRTVFTVTGVILAVATVAGARAIRPHPVGTPHPHPR